VDSQTTGTGIVFERKFLAKLYTARAYFRAGASVDYCSLFFSTPQIEFICLFVMDQKSLKDLEAELATLNKQLLSL
jgi:hypothetical protein